MTLAEMVAQVKRRIPTGDINNTTDRINTDIVLAVNNKRYQAWRYHDWDWSREELSQATTSEDVTLGSTVGKILVLGIADQVDYLKHITFKEYLKWEKSVTSDTGSPFAYMKTGRNSSGNQRLRLVPAPESSVTLEGWFKLRLTRYALTDIATNTGIDFFPVETHDILLEGVMGEVLEIAGKKVEGKAKVDYFYAELAKLVSEEENQPDEEVQSPPPDIMRWKKRRRGGTIVV